MINMNINQLKVTYGSFCGLVTPFSTLTPDDSLQT